MDFNQITENSCFLDESNLLVDVNKTNSRKVLNNLSPIGLPYNTVLYYMKNSSLINEKVPGTTRLTGFFKTLGSDNATLMNLQGSFLKYNTGQNAVPVAGLNNYDQASIALKNIMAKAGLKSYNPFPVTPEDMNICRSEICFYIYVNNHERQAFLKKLGKLARACGLPIKFCGVEDGDDLVEVQTLYLNRINKPRNPGAAQSPACPSMILYLKDIEMQSKNPEGWSSLDKDTKDMLENAIRVGIRLPARYFNGFKPLHMIVKKILKRFNKLLERHSTRKVSIFSEIINLKPYMLENNLGDVSKLLKISELPVIEQKITFWKRLRSKFFETNELRRVEEDEYEEKYEESCKTKDKVIYLDITSLPGVIPKKISHSGKYDGEWTPDWKKFENGSFGHTNEDEIEDDDDYDYDVEDDVEMLVRPVQSALDENDYEDEDSEEGAESLEKLLNPLGLPSLTLPKMPKITCFSSCFSSFFDSPVSEHTPFFNAQEYVEKRLHCEEMLD